MQAKKLTRIIWMMMIGAMILQTAEAQRRPRIISPEVRSDRTVTFRFHAPRALAGLSMGGFQTLDIGISRMDLFGWIGVFSGGIRDTYEQSHGPFLDSANEKLKLFWIGIGKTDFLLERNENLLKLLRKKSD